MDASVLSQFERTLEKQYPGVQERVQSSPALEYFSQQGAENKGIICCSGGADSVFLSCFLLNYFSNARERFVVVGVDHAQRPQSAQDSQWVSNFASTLGLKCFIKRLNINSDASEDVLRKGRYAAIESLAFEKGASALFLGQHLNDIAEGMIMRLFSGSELSALASPRAVQKFSHRPTRLRPLLAVKSEEIREILRTAGVEWLEDSSNASDKFTRNRVRHSVIPKIEEAIPQDVYSGLKRTCSFLDEASSALEQWVESEFLQRSSNSLMGSFRLQGIHKLPVCIVRGVFWKFWHEVSECTESPSGAAVDQAIRFIRREGSIRGPVRLSEECELDICHSSSDGLIAVIRKPKLASFPKWRGLKWAWSSGDLYLPDGAVLRAEPVSGDSADLLALAKTMNPDLGALVALGSESILLVERWKSGDRMLALGAPGTRKLQDIFTDRKVPFSIRRTVPILRSGSGEIVYVPFIGPSDSVKVRATTKLALRLTYDYL